MRGKTLSFPSMEALKTRSLVGFPFLTVRFLCVFGVASIVSTESYNFNWVSIAEIITDTSLRLNCLEHLFCPHPCARVFHSYRRVLRLRRSICGKAVLFRKVLSKNSCGYAARHLMLR